MQLKGVGHGTFTDFPLLLDQTTITRFLSQVIPVDIGASSVQACKAIEKLKPFIVGFFDKYLQDKATPLFDQSNCDIALDI